MRTDRLLTIFLSVLILSGCNSQRNRTTDGHIAFNSLRQDEMSDSIDNIPVISFTMDDINGKPVSIKDEISKYKITIIDFWASWCGPCRQEMPVIVDIHNKFEKAGLCIIGVSLDEDKKQWKDAVNKMNMKWLQLSDLQGWNNSAAQMYGIQSIPFTIIVDNKGHVLASGLRGEELKIFIEKSLSDSTSTQL